jgi:Rad/Gem-related GTP binding protein 1
MAVNSPGTYPISPRSPKSPVPNSPAVSKSSSHFNFAPPRSPGGPKSPNHYCPKSPGSSKNSTHFTFGPKSPGAPKSPTNFNCGPKSPGGPNSPRQQFTFGPKSPGSLKSSSQFTFGPKSPVGSRSPSTTPRSPDGYHRSSSIGTRSPSSRTESSISSFSSNSNIPSGCNLQNAIAGSNHDVTSTDTTSTSSSSWTRCRRSTSDLTDLMEEDCSTTATSLSRPCSPRSRAGSIKGGGLAYLASRRGSRDSQASQASAEDVGPLNFSSNPRGRQRRKSNFLELPGNFCSIELWCVVCGLFILESIV